MARTPHISERLLTVALVALALATVGVQTVGAANMGLRPATANDTWIQCGYGEVDFMAPGFASPARRSIFAYTLNNGPLQYSSQWLYFAGSRSWYSANGWIPFGGYVSLEHLATNSVVHAWEYRLFDNGAGYYTDLGSCIVERNPMDDSNYVWDYQPL